MLIIYKLLVSDRKFIVDVVTQFSGAAGRCKKESKELTVVSEIYNKLDLQKERCMEQ